MAQSPSHKLGQLIGTQFEAAMREPLKQVAAEYHLYLDYEHPRLVRNGKREVAWTDAYGNTHRLDYVLEEGGSERHTGHPRAFIELAWRRYTKHSRNKAQEIQGAVRPLAERYGQHAPFLGAILSGVFTANSVEQLRSHGFTVAYCPYEDIVEAFRRSGLDVAFDESMSDLALQRKVESFERTTEMTRQQIRQTILQVGRAAFVPFFATLRTCLDRDVTQIRILTLSGISYDFASVDKAVQFIASHDETAPAMQFVRYEILVQYSTGDEVRGNFQTKSRAITFLQKFHRGVR